MARETAKARIQRLIEDRGYVAIGASEWDALIVELPDVSEATLRKHLKDLPVRVQQPWRGVETETFEALEQSLCELAAAYVTQPKLTRAIVIAAKDRTRFASRNRKVPDDKRMLKSEMVDWMLVWLGDPGMFADWARLRLTQLAPKPD